MKIINISDSTKFLLIPREFVSYSSSTLTLRDELKNTVEEHSITLTIVDGYYEIDMKDFDLTLNYKYSFKITDVDDFVIFEGRLFIMNDEQSVQDYKTTIITPNNKTRF